MVSERARARAAGLALGLVLVWGHGVRAQSAPDEDAASADATADPATGGTSSADGTPILESSGQVTDETSEEIVDADEDQAPAVIRYSIERIEVRGNSRTSASVVRRFIPLAVGDVLDIDDPAIELLRWRLLGTGWFDDVKLRLRRGTQRGWVALIVEVEERNTLVVEQLVVGATEEVRSSADRSTSLSPYAGVSIGDSNLFGWGTAVSAAVLVSRPQQGFRLRVADSMVLGRNVGVGGTFFFNNAREFFGDDDALVSIRPCTPEEIAADDCPPELEARNAVVLYQRGGVSLSTTHDVGVTGRLALTWQGEVIDVGVRPDAASERRGTRIVPIDFSIDDGTSVVSLLGANLSFDRRDDPYLARRGAFFDLRADLGSALFGSDYEFVKLQALARAWIPLPWGHTLRLGAFGGVVLGRAPFFHKFYAADLSDLVPSRVLELNLDRRAPPNLLGTAVEEMRHEEVAARVDLEYGVRLYTGRRGLRGVHAYAGAGLYALADRRDLGLAIPGYRGLSQIPIDLTFDLGVRFDTSVGLFQLGFSTLLGFVAL